MFTIYNRMRRVKYKTILYLLLLFVYKFYLLFIYNLFLLVVNKGVNKQQ